MDEIPARQQRSSVLIGLAVAYLLGYAAHVDTGATQALTLGDTHFCAVRGRATPTRDPTAAAA